MAKFLKSGGSNNQNNPGEVSNQQLLIDRKEFLQIRNPGERLRYLNAPLKGTVVLERDVFQISEAVWKLLQNSYRGEEIKRYSIFKNATVGIERAIHLPTVRSLLMRNASCLYR